MLIFDSVRPVLDDVCLRDSLNDDNRDRAVKMRGLPWKVKPEEIVEFFKGGDITIKNEDVVIEVQEGKVTGYGLAFMPTTEDAETAIESLNREHIGSRFILLGTPWKDKLILKIGKFDVELNSNVPNIVVCQWRNFT